MKKEDYVKGIVKKTAELVDEQNKIIELLKTQYKDVYDWFSEHKIDLKALGKYAKQIGMVFVLCLSLMTAVTPTSTSSVTENTYKIMVDSQRLRSMSSDEQRALTVWNQHSREITETSVKYGVDPKIIFATIMVESMGNPHALRYEPHLNDSSYGLGQLLYSTARYIGYTGAPEGLYDPAVNIELVGRYHKRSLDIYGDLNPDQLATAYNAGNPYGTPTYGHVQKFEKWYQILNRFVVS